MKKENGRKSHESFWNFYAMLYDSLRALFPYRELIQTAAKQAEDYSIHDLVLDAGCGTGNLEKFIDDHEGFSIKILGCDSSPYMLKRALRKSKNSFIRVDLDQPLPFKEHSFGGLISINSLYALKDPSYSLQEFHRVLSARGILIMATPKNNPRMLDVFKEHLKSIFSLPLLVCIKEIARTLAISPLLLAVVILNIFIIKRLANQKEFFFFQQETIKSLIEGKGFRIKEIGYAYGGTDVYIVAEKLPTDTEIKNIIKGVTVKIAETAEEMRDIYRLRYDVYCKEMYSLDAIDYPDKEEKDRYDDNAIHIIAKYKNRIIACIRLIKDTPEGFLMEEQFVLPASIDRTKTIEYSRGLVHRGYRGMGICNILLDKALEWRKENGYVTGIGAPVNDSMKPIFEKRDWDQIGPSETYHNVYVTPMVHLLEAVNK